MQVCEVYTSVQGEGPNTGRPITFIRFGGCNLRCPGWGTGELPDGTVVPGCDTVFAVYPEWRDTWESKSVEDILAMVPEEPKHVCLTGGEPLIQRSKQLQELVDQLLYEGYDIDVFTNGTQLLPSWAFNPDVTVIMDYKLPGSEEWGSFNIGNAPLLGEKDAIKFVCKNTYDFDVACKFLQEHDIRAQAWFAPVWDHMHPSQLADLVSNYYPEGRLNIQTHKYVWSPEARRV